MRGCIQFSLDCESGDFIIELGRPLPMLISFTRALEESLGSGQFVPVLPIQTLHRYTRPEIAPWMEP